MALTGNEHFNINIDVDLVVDELGERMMMDIEPFVPFDTGALARSGHMEGHSIVYDAPHAEKMYNSPNKMRTQAHPLATARWIEVAEEIHGEKWRNLARHLIAMSIDGTL